MKKFLSLASLMLAMFAAVPAQALPPAPLTIPEAKAASEAIFKANWYPVGPVTAEQAANNKRSHDQGLRDASRLLPIACAKNDAWACRKMAVWQAYYQATANPRMTRQQAANKAGLLYGELCQAETGYSPMCREMQDLLDEVAMRDKEEPHYATDGIPSAWLKLGQIYAGRCRDEGGTSFGIKGNCSQALTIFDQRSPSEAGSLRDFMCTKGDAGACHKLGRLTAAETSDNDQMAKQCNAGAGKSCTMLAGYWMHREDAPDRSAHMRQWAGKGCNLNDMMSCLILGQDLATSQPVNYAGAADAFGKACRNYTGRDKDAACKNETIIRNALATKK